MKVTKAMSVDCECSDKLKVLEKQIEILLSALKQIELMGNGTQTKEAIFASLILKSISEL